MSLRTALLALLFCADLRPLAAANVTHDYLVDRSAVPATVFHRKLTLLIDLGNCSGCQAMADGVSTTATWLAATKQCRVELGGGVTGLSVTGLNWTGGGTGVATKANLYRDKKWAYSFTWDDSRDSVLPNAKPVFDTYGYRAGMAINPGIMGGWGYMTWDDLDQLYAAGWGVFNHSWDHDSANGVGITNANVNAQIDPARAAIEARYPGYPDSYFVYPYNYINDWDAIKAKGFLGAEAETGENYVDVWPLETSPQASATGNGATNADSLWLLRRHQAYRDTPVSTWNSWLDSAAADARPRWCIAFSHQCIASPGFYDVTPAMLNTHLGYLYNTYGAGGADNVWVAPSEEVLHYLYARRYTVLTRQGAPLTPSSTPTWSPPSPTRTVTPTPTSTPTLTPFPCGATVLRRVNSGGTAYTDGGGRLWEADQTFYGGGWGAVGGTADSAANPIAGTTDDLLYQTERWGSPVEYRFTVPNGTYQVRLLFAEVYWTAAGARVFDISLEGALAVDDLDIWALVGKDRPTELTRTVTVSDGVLNIVATASADAAKFSALEISYVNACSSPSPSPSATRTLSSTPSLTPTPSRTSAPQTATLSATPSLSPTLTSPTTPTLSATPQAGLSLTPSGTVTATPPASPSRTPTGSPTPTALLTATFTATATGTSTATVTTTHTPGLTASCTSTFTSTSTVPATAAVSATFTSTLTPGQSPALTPTSSASATPSLSPTPLASLTPTCACLWTPTTTPTATLVATALPIDGGGELKVEAALAEPNPNPGALAFKLSRRAEQVELRIYGRSQACLATVLGTGPWPSGWNRLALPADWSGSVANGTYHVAVLAKGPGQGKASRALCRAVFLR
jgi:hypothetical protein